MVYWRKSWVSSLLEKAPNLSVSGHTVGHCAASQKVAGSIPNGVIGIFFIDVLPPLGLTQPLTEMSTRNIYWGVKAAGA
jgi:hypothetical protein